MPTANFTETRKGSKNFKNRKNKCIKQNFKNKKVKCPYCNKIRHWEKIAGLKLNVLIAKIQEEDLLFSLKLKKLRKSLNAKKQQKYSPI